jgi:hypothetical protein
VKEETPVPPLETERMPVIVERVDVAPWYHVPLLMPAMPVHDEEFWPVPPRVFASALVRVSAVAALPEMLILIGEEVEMEARVLTPVAYRRPEAAEIGEEVERPPKEIVGVAPPLEMMGQVPVTEVTPLLIEEVATH